MAQLTIKLLGRFEVYIAGTPIIIFETNKLRALLAYLAVEADRPHVREALAGLLWPDSPQSSAMVSLRHALSALRTAIGDRAARPPFLLITRKTIQINREGDLQVDLWDFERIPGKSSGRSDQPASIAGLQAAIELYTGPLLDGFNANSDVFDSWLRVRREGLSRQARRTLSELALLQAGAGEHMTSILAARRLLDLEPWDEQAHRLLMRGLALCGQRSAALAQFEACRQVLNKELSVEPETETVSLYEAIRSGRFGAESGQEATSVPDRHSNDEALRHHLLAGWPPLIGREQELVEVGTCLNDPACRLLTLVGPGGIGKTHLALEAGAGQADRFPQGVYFVSLAAVQSVDTLPLAIAQALGLTFSSGGEPVQQLFDYLEKKKLLLILDNFEHLLEGAVLLTAILRAASRVKLLVTSRARLNLREEFLYQVEGLDFPRPQLGNVSDYAAVKLFLEGTRRVQPGFEVAKGDWEAIRQICQAVHGMPLAILLAAGWIVLLAPGEIAREITGHSMDFLQADWQDLPARQRSMRAVFDVSFKLLSPREQEIFAGLAVFRGGFTLASAQAVTGATLGELRALIEKSLVQRASAERFTLHELLRQYAAEVLARSPELYETTRDRHAAYFAAALADWWKDFHGPRQFQTLEALGMEFENALAAWDWMAEHIQVERINQAFLMVNSYLPTFYGAAQGVEVGKRLFSAVETSLAPLVLPAPADFVDGSRLLVRLWLHQPDFMYKISKEWNSVLKRCEALLDQLEAAGEDVREEKAILLYQLGQLSAEAGEAEAMRRQWGQALLLYRASGELWREAWLLHYWGWVSVQLGEQEQGCQMLQESIMLFRGLGNQINLRQALMNMREVAWNMLQGDFDPYEPLLREHVAACQAAGNPALIAASQGELGAFYLRQGKFAAGYPELAESFAALEALGNMAGSHFYGLFLSEVQTHLGQFEQAHARCQSLISYYRKTNQNILVGYNLLLLGWSALGLRQYEQAAQYLEEVDAAETPLRMNERALGFASLAYAERGLGRPERAAALLVRTLSIGVELKLAPVFIFGLPAAALLLADRGEIERALEVYALAARYRYVADSRWFASVVERDLTARAAGLQADAAAAAQARGRNRDLISTAEELLADFREWPSAK